MARLIWWNPVRKKAKGRKVKKTPKAKARRSTGRKTKARKTAKRAISVSDAAALRRILKRHGY